MRAAISRHAGLVVAALALAGADAAAAQGGSESEHWALGNDTPRKPLLIPQVEGERQGRIVGRAVACGAPADRVDRALRLARARIRAAVGGPFTQDRYEPALGRAIDFEASLGRPSENACIAALDAFAQFEAVQD